MSAAGGQGLTVAPAPVASPVLSRQAWDAIVIGGGHNGLVCGAYLARGGLRTLILERRDIMGGALATSELLPGARVPAFAQTVGRLRGSIARELDLAGHGLRLVQPAARVTSLRSDGPAITLWGDVERTAVDLAGVSRRDAAAWTGFDAEIRALAGLLSMVMSTTPPDPSEPAAGDVLLALRLGLRYRGLEPAHARALLRALPQPVADFLDDRLENDALRAILAVRGMRYSSLGPHSAGSTQVLLADSAGNDGGAAGETVLARGGPGALAAALVGAARRAGAELRTGARVVSVRERDGRAAGIALASGEELAADVVVSGLDARTTLLDLLDPVSLGPTLGWQAGNLRQRGVTAKVDLALAELPVFRGLDGEDAALRLRGRIVVAPSVAYLDRAADAAKYGRASAEPWLEATIPSLADPLLVDGAATSGVRHVMSVLMQSAPHTLREGDWTHQRESLADAAMAVLEGVAPGIGRLVVARHVVTPVDVEQTLGTSGGHPFHAEPGLDQWYAWRPLLGYARYRMPLPGLYLCSAAAHPGGGVTGLPGRNAAREILADRRRG